MHARRLQVRLLLMREHILRYPACKILLELEVTSTRPQYAHVICDVMRFVGLDCTDLLLSPF